MQRTLFFYLTRVIALLIAFPLLSAFSGSHNPRELLDTAMRLSPLEQIGVVTVIFVIAAIAMELLAGVGKLLAAIELLAAYVFGKLRRG